VVRVELFDPDAINQITNTHTISHNAADGRSPTNATCANPARQDSCLLLTGEEDVPLQNTHWLVRVDEDRGSETPGICATPATISRQATAISLSWQGGEGQEVWHSPFPFFTPGDRDTSATFTAGNDYTERELLNTAPFSRYYRVVPAAESATHCQALGVFSFPLQRP